MKSRKIITYLVGIVGVSSLTFIFIYAQTKTDNAKMSEDEMKNCPMHEQHQKELKEKASNSNQDHPKMTEMIIRGEREMGFSQTKTTHHFLLSSDGGAIQVEVNDANDKDNLEQIRKHLAQIADSFTNGDFATPMAVHGELPPGAKIMQLLKTKISSEFSETEKGARVKISTQDQVAQAAIYDFLRYQIVEHQTGDPLEIAK